LGTIAVGEALQQFGFGSGVGDAAVALFDTADRWHLGDNAFDTWV
jgi:hypothetical protein